MRISRAAISHPPNGSLVITARPILTSSKLDFMISPISDQLPFEAPRPWPALTFCESLCLFSACSTQAAQWRRQTRKTAPAFL